MSSVITLHSINERRPGRRWQQLYDAVGPAYLAWYLSEGVAVRPSLSEASDRLRRHMPELVPTWEALVELAGDSEDAARMLTLWDPPKFLPGCSQAVLTSPDAALIRNYDYTPDLLEQVVYSSAFRGKQVIGTSDCLWGLLDGMNEDGLAISLAFGGRPGSRPGFAAPLVVRYLLEVASTVAEAREALAGIPVSMSYNLTMVDAGHESCTAFVAPDTDPEFLPVAAATNHRGREPEFPEHASRFRSVERQDILLAAIDVGLDVDTFGDLMLQPPLRSDDYDHAFGTLYTATYRVHARTLEYRWPGDRWMRTFASPEGTKTVTLNPSDPAAGPDPHPADGGWAEDPAAEHQVSSVSGPSPSAVELGQTASAAVAQLAAHPDPAAFAELLKLSAEVGTALGSSARLLAERGSWAQVADVAGVTRQAAWYRWRD